MLIVIRLNVYMLRVIIQNVVMFSAICCVMAFLQYPTLRVKPGNTKGGSISVPLTSCLTGLDRSVFEIKTNIVSCQTADSKTVKQEVNGTVILPP
jgi:hypothetical protein